MANQNMQASEANVPWRVRLNRYRCVVCGELRAGVTGYVFYQSARTRLGAPFCKKHIDQCHLYANPIFENQTALELFKQKYPQAYKEDVECKPILFFNTHKQNKL